MAVLFRSVKSMKKSKQQVTINHRLEKIKEKWPCDIPGWILEQKKDTGAQTRGIWIGAKTGGIWIKSIA